MPRLDALFRLSFYLCLTLSTASLAFAVFGQLQDTIFFYIPMLCLVALAYKLNDRWTLSVRASNLLAVGIMVAWPIFLVFSLKGNRVRTDELEVELVRLALPAFAPLISTLLLAKLFRPKALRDYWTIHLMGLVQMVLACVLAMTNKLDRDAPLFPLAVLAYLLTLVWTLRNFNLYSLHMAPARGAAAQRGPASDPRGADAARAPVGVRTSLGWFVLSTLLGLTIFFVIPRGGGSLADATSGLFMRPAQTGFKPSMDLTGEGKLAESEELVFRAAVRDRNGNNVQLGGLPRWRGVSCALYENGRWRPFRKDLASAGRYGALAPDFGDLAISYELDIRKVRQGGLVSTDEVPNRAPGEIPLFTLETYALDSKPGEGRNSTAQVILDPNSPPGDVARGVAPGSVSLHVSRQEACASATLLEHRPVRNVFYQQLIARRDVGRPEWTQEVSDDRARGMGQYIRELSRLPRQDADRLRQIAEDFLKAEQTPADAEPAKKARALERRLVETGGFGYSLERRRQDHSLDPNIDFLVNVKQGTCERFASALALLLRSIGIPARIVIGFRGADWNSLGQFYEVREFHSHAWVEAAADWKRGTVRVDGIDQPTAADIHWLSLDPTPQLESQSREQGIWAQNVSFARMLWEFFILDFSGDLQRQRFFSQLNRLGWDRLEAALRRYGTIGLVLWAVALVVCLVLAVILVRLAKSVWRNWRAQRKAYAWLPAVPFWRQAIGLLMRRWRVKPRQSQTASEYAADAAAKLKADASGAPLADIPPELAERYYAVRFGGASPDSEGEAAEPQLRALAQAKPA